MKFSMRKVAVAAASVLVAIASGSAAAAPSFTVNPSAILGSGPTSVTGDNFIGGSSELLHLYDNGAGDVGNKTAAGQYGYATINSLINNGNAVNAGFGFGDGFAGQYQLYLTFTLDVKLVSGTNGTAGSTYSVNQLNYQLWADPTNNTTFTKANAATNTEASISDAGNDKVLLGFGQVLAGSASINPLAGVGLNAINTFALCSGAGAATVGGLAIPGAGCTSGAGTAYFVDPVPFYDLVFSGFINAALSPVVNTQGTADVNDDVISIVDATSTITFNRVPEPGSLALVALGLLGVGAARRNKKPS